MSTHIVFSDAHAHPDYHNERAEWLGKLIADVQPDVVINNGDQGDFPSLCSYDKGKKSFQGRSYRQDVDSFLDFSDRLWSTVRARKKKLPRRVFVVGNHEERIRRAIEMQPELDGAIGYGDLYLDKDYDEIVDYSGGTPGTITIDGVTYAHYFVSGLMGRAIMSDVSVAAALLAKQHASCTTGHNHLLDMSVKTNSLGNKIIGLSTGCFLDHDLNWAGVTNRMWSCGCVIKRNVSNGMYNFQWVSMEALKEQYG